MGSEQKNTQEGESDEGPTKEMLAGRRELDGISGVTILRDWFPTEEVGLWALQIRLRIDTPTSAFVPESTDWYALVSADYPHGALRLHPAAEGGITCTFPHQMSNHEVSDNGLWRSGFLCLSYPDRSLGRGARVQSPKTVYGCLSWNVYRALAWLRDAAAGTLRRDGDDFEHPNFPKGSSFRLAYQESKESFQQSVDRGLWGYVDFGQLPNSKRELFVKSILSPKLELLQTLEWGDSLKARTVTHRGVWLKLPRTPVMEPWQAPLTWLELRQCCYEQGIDIDRFLQFSLGQLRDGARHFFSLVYPIPEKVGGAGAQLHWQTVELPALEHAPGFRAGSAVNWQYERANGFANKRKLKWCAGRNWTPAEVYSRGRLPSVLENRKVLLLGCGALGSCIAEMLARAGLKKLQLIDADDFHIGNSTRHTLGLESIGECKAHALARKLRLASPHITVGSAEVWFEASSPTSRRLFDWADLVIDCTGEDGVIHAASHLCGNRSDLEFVSLSISAGAKRGYLFCANGGPFLAAFQDALRPWIAKDVGDYPQLVREGIGCWHPVFPARSDDIWLLSAAMTKAMIDRLSEDNKARGLTVFGQRTNSGGQFLGVEVLNPEMIGQEHAA